ncbi:von Willebrand factor D and EGF domain-containing protein-like, partial [Saccostrea cucullata]|uniref:von Willebrand factor D and EGF domain-containing protein-like n=1 Tax=Saccostrea cuccullata TaxID=36930 RepID=UPI002ED59292
MIFCVVLLLSASFGIAIGQQDPCLENVYSTIPHLVKRNPSYAMDAVPICDRYLPKQWYRAGFHSMPTFGPKLTDCGTLYPYWMNGSLPGNGTVANVTVCQVGFENKCATSHTIQVKNCGLYAVYELTPLTSCNAAYCFQPSTTCVEGVPTNISVSYYNVSWESLPNETAPYRIHKPSVNLVCNFEPINNGGLLYEVNWFIDNKEVLRNQTLSSDERMNAILSASQILRINGRAGSMIHCVVGAKFRAEDSPCSSKSSPLFFAGIKLLKDKFEIKRNESCLLQYQFTIPFAFNTVVINNTEIDAFLYITTDVNKDVPSACDDNNYRNCETKIASYRFSERSQYETDEWKSIRNWTFYNTDDNDYKSENHHITLRLIAEGPPGDLHTDPVRIFEKIHLPDVKILVTESSNVWKGQQCSSTTDPNIRTFDGDLYQCMLIGTFQLYKNEAYNQEVQEKHYMCQPDAACNCAAAVRSGRDIFTIDICNGGQQIINFPLCDDGVLKVVKKNDRRYEILLPTGTVVDISIYWDTDNGWFLKIRIYPSTSDVENVEGLCGNLDGNWRNDRRGRDNVLYNRYENNPDNFSRTW